MTNVPAHAAANAVPVPRHAGARLSLRTRVAINVVAVTALIQLVLGAVTFLYFQATIDQFFNARIVARLNWAKDELANSADPLSNELLETISDRSIRMVMFNSLVLIARDDTGKALATSDTHVDPTGLPTPRETPERHEIAIVNLAGIATGGAERAPARTVTVPVTLKDGRHIFLTGAVSNTTAADTISVVGRAVLLVSLFGLVATGAAAWFVTGVSLKPLSRLRNVAEQFNLETISQPPQRGGGSIDPVPELAQLSAELDAARDRIRQAIQANDRFISNVSHELKTPVAVLRAQAQTIDATDIPPKTREFVRSVIEETRRLGTMVDSFLTLASVRSGRSLNATRPVYLNDVMLETIAHCAVIARQSNVTIVPELYEADEDLVVAGDPDLLRVLFDNLLRNAVRFSPAGTTVVASVSLDETGVTVSITDSGPGIPSEILPKLFERFTQASDEIGRGRGHGLGLSIAQGIAELHGGLITVTNLPAGGCRFAISLPRVHAHPHSTDAGSPSHPLPPSPNPPTPPSPPFSTPASSPTTPADKTNGSHADRPATLAASTPDKQP